MPSETIAIIETTLDDMNPEIYEYVIDRLLELGARDVFLQPVIMKKSRPGATLTVLCDVDQVEALSELIMAETTTIGVRWRQEQRLVADQRNEYVETSVGKVRVKLAELKGRLVNMSPEFEDCKQLALETGVPLKEIFELARAEALRRFGPSLPG